MVARSLACRLLPVLSLSTLVLLTAACEKPKVVQVPVGSETTEAILWRSDKDPSPAVLLLARPGESKEAWLPLAGKFHKAGFGILALDLRGDAQVGELSMHEDVRAGFAFLRLQDRVDAARIGLVGVQTAADAALRFAAEEPMVQFVVLASPGLPLRDFELEEVAHEYGFRPMFVSSSEPDRSSREAARRLSEAIRGDTVVKRYPLAAGADAFLDAAGPFGQDVLVFLKARL